MRSSNADEAEDDGEPVEPGVVAADDEESCCEMRSAAATAAMGCGAKSPKGTMTWTKWLKSTAKRCERFGQAVEVPAQRVGERLGFVVEVQAGEVAPAGVVAELDEAGAELRCGRASSAG